MGPQQVQAPVTPPPQLSPRDREWLTLYLELNEDLHALAAHLAAAAPSGQSSPGPWRVASCEVPSAPPSPLSPPPSLLELASWLRTPSIRAALADWDYAQRRARAARDEADRRIAIDALKTACLALSCHRLAPPGDSLHPSTSSTQHAGAEPPFGSAPAAASADQSGTPAPSDFARLVETRRSATALLRALSGAMATARRGYAHRHLSTQHSARSTQHSRPRPRRIADFNLGPEAAERFLERERRENDRLEKLIQRAVAVSDAPRAEYCDDCGGVLPGDEPPSGHPPRFGGGGWGPQPLSIAVGDPSPERSGGETEGAFSSPRSSTLDVALTARASTSNEGHAAGLAARAGHAYADTG